MMSLDPIAAVAPQAPEPAPTDVASDPAGAWLSSVERSMSAFQGPLAPAAVAERAAAPAAAETCTVETRHYEVADTPFGNPHHAFIVTTDADSQNYVRGGPANEGGPSGGSNSSDSSGSSGSPSSSSSGGNGPWGSIDTDYGPYVEGTIDWREEPLPTETVAVLPGNCDAIEAEMRGHADAIEDAEIRYAPLGDNSNSVVSEVLDRSGLPIPNPPVDSPGWGRELA